MLCLSVASDWSEGIWAWPAVSTRWRSSPARRLTRRARCRRCRSATTTWRPDDADVIVALGGDGLMLQTLHRFMGTAKPIYGMNKGTVGFLMNEFREDDLFERLEKPSAASCTRF